MKKSTIIITVLVLATLIGLVGWKNYYEVGLFTDDIILFNEREVSKSVTHLISFYDEPEEFEIKLDRLITDFARVDSALSIYIGTNMIGGDKETDHKRKLKFYRLVGEELIGMRYLVNKNQATYEDYLGDLNVLDALVSDLETAELEGKTWEYVLTEYLEEYPDNKLFFNQTEN